MRQVIVPERYNYVAAFLTLRCNLGCSYCINNNSGIERARSEMSGDEWASYLNRLQIREDVPVTLEGGEPTMHSDFYRILENTRHPKDLLTNLQFDVDEFTRRVDPKWFNNRSSLPAYKSIRASFHSEKMNIEDTINKAVKLQEAGFAVGIFSLNLPESLESNMQMAESARKNQLYFFIKDFLGYRGGRLFGHFKYPEALDGKRKEVACKTRELLIAPDGKIYRCHHDLYHQAGAIGDIKEESYQIEDIFRPCTNYGECNPCDIKLKTNRFLQMGSCSVEMKPI